MFNPLSNDSENIYSEIEEGREGQRNRGRDTQRETQFILEQRRFEL